MSSFELISEYALAAGQQLQDMSLLVSVPLVFATAIVLTIVFNALYQVVYKIIYPHYAPVVPYLFPWIGSAVSYGMDPYAFFNSCREKYGDQFAFVMCGRTVTVYLGPKGNEFVFNSKPHELSAEAAYTHLTTPAFGKGVVYDCPNHRLMEQKKFAKSAMTRAAFRANVPRIIEEVTNFTQTKQFKENSGVVPIMDFTSEVIIYTAARNMGGEEVRAKFSARTAKLFEDIDKAFTPLNFVFPNLPLPSYWARDVAQKEISSQYMEVINRRRTEEKGEVHERDLIDALMHSSTYKDGVKMSDQEIANLMIGILMGGQHTSSTTSAWIMLHLAQKPEYQQKLYDEQLAVCGKGEDGLPNHVTYDDLQEMPLLNAVIKEILRLHSPLHSLLRKVMVDLPITGTPYVVPKGHFMLVALGHPMIAEEYFKDSEKFVPERWLGVEDIPQELADYGFGEVSTGAGSPYLPFGGGRHRCIGEQFAFVQLGTIISIMVREFKWTLPEGTKLPKPDYTSMVTIPEKPANIAYVRRIVSN